MRPYRFYLKTCVIGLIIACLLAACRASDPFTALEAGETGRVVRIIDGDTLALDTGQSVQLVSIIAPAPPRNDTPGEPYADESFRRLETLALGRTVQLFYSGLTRDRYKRALAHVRTIDTVGRDIWLNEEMVRSGGARVRLYADTALFSDHFLNLEREARAAQKGLWQETAYMPQRAVDLEPSVSGFMLLYGELGPAQDVSDTRSARYNSCERALMGSALQVRISHAAQHWCVSDLNGTTVFLRGWIKDGYITLRHPQHLSIE